MGMKIDGIATNQQIDSSGEILNIAGHDISDLVEGRGVLNFEHEKGAEDIIGAVIYAKKIFSEADCENERQKMYWKLSGAPFVYIICELFDDEEHPGALAIAALIRYYARNKEKLLVGFSIEGQTLERNGLRLERSVGRRVALTLRPCNKSCIANLLEDSQLKTVVEKAEKSNDSTRLYEVDSIIVDDDIMHVNLWAELKSAADLLSKTVTAGTTNVAPAQLVGFAALTPEEFTLRNRVRAVIRDWDRIKPLKDALKAALPEVSEQYLDYFIHLANAITLRKNKHQTQSIRISSADSDNPMSNAEQKQLLDGLYININQLQKLSSDTKDYLSYSVPLLNSVNDAGQEVIIKPSKDIILDEKHNIKLTTAVCATWFYQLVKYFFKLSNIVPITNYFSCTITNNNSIQQFGAHLNISAPSLLLLSNDKYNIIVSYLKRTGLFYQIFLIDQILGMFTYRNLNNVLVDTNHNIFLVDNEYAFINQPSMITCMYLSPNELTYIYKDILPINVNKWLQKLQPIKLMALMKSYKIPKEIIKLVVKRLTTLQQLAKNYTSCDKLIIIKNN